MEIRKNSWHAIFYKATYGSLDKSLCTYFWKLISAFILLPFSWLGYLIPEFREDTGISGKLFITTICLYLIVILIPFAIFEGTVGKQFYPDINLVFKWFFGFLMLAVTVIIALLISKIADVCNKPQQKETQKTNLVKERWKAFKGKYCPKINWK